jgi:hypothetical protein
MELPSARGQGSTGAEFKGVYWCGSMTLAIAARQVRNVWRSNVLGNELAHARREVRNENTGENF